MNSFQTKYKIINKIGEGSFSDVIKCLHKGSGKEYAAKRLKKIYRTEESIEQCAEIIALKKISHHRNILNMLEYYYDFFTGQVIFVFDMMDMSLYDFMVLKKYPLSEEKSKIFLFQIISGVDHLHKCGFFHRDIKPENILIKFTSEIEIIKVADFGSIRGIYSMHPYTEYISTRWYRSPECLLTIGHYTSKMDVWAIGCVFYEILTFKPLFPGSNEIDQLAKIHKIIGAPSISVLNKLKPKSKNSIAFPPTKGVGLYSLIPKVSYDCRSIIDQMLEYDPFKRINTKRLMRHSYFHEYRQGKRLNIHQEFKIKEMPLRKQVANFHRPNNTADTTFKKVSLLSDSSTRSKSSGSKTHEFSRNPTKLKNNRHNMSEKAIRTNFEKIILATLAEHHLVSKLTNLPASHTSSNKFVRTLKGTR